MDGVHLKEYISQDSTYPNAMLETLHEMQKTNYMCDVQLLVEDKKINAHKIVLGGCSPYFRTIFETDLRDKNDRQIAFKDMDYETLNSIVQYIYSGVLRLNANNYMKIMDAGNLMHLERLRPTVAEYLARNIQSGKCIEFYGYAKLYSYEDMADEIFAYFVNNAEKIVKKECYDNLSESLLMSVFFDKRMDVNVAVSAIQSLFTLRKLDIHFPPLCKESMPDYFAHLDRLYDRQRIYKCLIPVFKKLITKKFSEEVLDEETLPFAQKRVILTIGGFTAVPGATTNVECMSKDGVSMFLPSYGDDNMDQLSIPKLNQKRNYFACASLGNKVYVIGGEVDERIVNSCERYDTRTNTWEMIAPLPVDIRCPACCFVDHMLYVVGGENDGEEGILLLYMEKFDKWKIIPTSGLPNLVNHKAVSVRGTLYVLGGRGRETNSLSNNVYRFYRNIGIWTKVKCLPEIRENFGCTSHMEHIFVIGGKIFQQSLNSVLKYNTLKDEWFKCYNMPYPKFGFGCVIDEEYVYCIGGCDRVNGPLPTVEVYNIFTDRWHSHHNKLTVPRAFCQSALVDIQSESNFLNSLFTYGVYL